MKRANHRESHSQKKKKKSEAPKKLIKISLNVEDSVEDERL